MKCPSMDQWIQEAKKDPAASQCGMYLFHNGVVRSTPKAKVRNTEKTELTEESAGKTVTGMDFSFDPEKVEAAREKALKMPGIYYIRIWLNEGILEAGDDIMLVLAGGDIRPHVIDALQSLVGEIKNYCVSEKEIYND